MLQLTLTLFLIYHTPLTMAFMVKPTNISIADAKDQLNVNVIGLVQQPIEPHK